MEVEPKMRIILTAIDNNPHYQDHLKAFLMSMRMNSPGENIRVMLMDCTVNFAKSIEKIYPIDLKMRVTKNMSAYQRNYVRHEMFRNAFKDLDNESVAWIDPDCLVREKLNDFFWHNATGSTIKVWIRPGKNDKYRFQTGVYILGNVATTQAYIDGIIEGLEGRDDWMLPQKLIYELCEKYYVSPIQLKEKFNDSKFKDSSVIWHCKQSHFKHEKFQKEFQFYLKKANILCRRSL